MFSTSNVERCLFKIFTTRNQTDLGASVNKQQGQNTCFSHHQAVGVAFQLRLLASIGILSVPDEARHGGLVD